MYYHHKSNKNKPHAWRLITILKNGANARQFDKIKKTIRVPIETEKRPFERF